MYGVTIERRGVNPFATLLNITSACREELLTVQLGIEP